MVLPSNEKCAEVMKALDGDPALTHWERAFIEGNEGRTLFTDRQREVVDELMEKYELS